MKLNNKKKTQYADVVVLNEKGELLLLQRSYSSEFEPGKWCLPGGHIDEGEDAMTAAFRELQEEAGVDVIYGKSFLNKVSREDCVSHYYLTTIDSATMIYLDNEEHYRYSWVNMNDLHKFSLLKDLGEVLIDHLNIVPDIAANFDIYSKNNSIEDVSVEFFEIENLLKKGYIDQLIYKACKTTMLKKAFEVVKKAFDNGDINTQTFVESRDNYNKSLISINQS